MANLISMVANILMITFVLFSIFSWKKRGVKAKNEIGIKWRKNSWVDIISGIIIGFIAMLGIFFVERGLSFISVTAVNVGRLSIVTLSQILIMAALEELACRGLMLNGLMMLTKNKYISVLASAVIFGMAHAGNPHATVISIVSNSLGGVMYAIAYLEMKNLFFPIALHFSWNFFQGPIFGFPVSGLNFSGMISQSITSNNTTLMGGLYGPEGGFIGIGFRILVIVLTFIYVYIVVGKSKDNTCKYDCEY